MHVHRFCKLSNRTSLHALSVHVVMFKELKVESVSAAIKYLSLASNCSWACKRVKREQEKKN